MRRTRKPSAAIILVGGTLATGGCLPNNFWSDVFGVIVADTVTTVVEGQIFDVLAGDEQP
ncbi:MAG: hypothetical protein AABZ12_12245 [Planctomycetota bacterium]